MNADEIDRLFDAKAARRRELAAMSMSEKARLIEALRDAGLYLRRVKPRIGSAAIQANPVPPAKFDEVAEEDAIESGSERVPGGGSAGV